MGEIPFSGRDEGRQEERAGIAEARTTHFVFFRFVMRCIRDIHGVRVCAGMIGTLGRVPR